MLALLGLLGFCLFPYFFTVALRYTAAGQAVVILPTIPMLTLLFSAALGRERLTGRRILSLLIAAAGACVALDGTGLNGLSIGYASFGGNTLMFAAAISSAMYNVLVPPLAVWHGPIAVVLAAMFAGTVILAILPGPDIVGMLESDRKSVV